MEFKRSAYLLLKLKLICLFIPAILSAGIPVNHLHHFIESPKLSRWGEWGKLEHCPSDQVVIGMRLKVHDNQGLKDDSGLNAVKFYCQNPYSTAEYTSDIVSIASLVGNAGEWKKEFFCPIKPDGKFVAVGFQLRSETSTGLKDDTAGNNLKLVCSDLYQKQSYVYLEGDGTSRGDWTQQQLCKSGYAICGLQTQVEVSKSIDTTGLNNLKVRCCKADGSGNSNGTSIDSEDPQKELNPSGFKHRDGHTEEERQYNPAEQELIAIFNPDWKSDESYFPPPSNHNATVEEERKVTTDSANEEETLPEEIASIDQTDNSESQDIDKPSTTKYSQNIPDDVVNALEDADSPDGNEEEQTASEDEDDDTSKNFSDEDFSLYTNYKESNERTNFHMQDSEESNEFEDPKHPSQDEEEFRSNSSPQQGQAETNVTAASSSASGKYSHWQSLGVGYMIMLMFVRLI